jgi:hypothetical protein
MRNNTRRRKSQSYLNLSLQLPLPLQLKNLDLFGEIQINGFGSINL